ncbi:MAG: monovalent cation/H(+) antiporter subunit G [Ignavibacteriales bacterium]|jgi:multicomponent Na+:H+ antiporter subunit G|nr:monovalent cation/H(+) antiporter subunit G [Melioribacteraceae bacterium]RJP60636.1 MAG: monovalent cation/H(+) antiporter subunit G [Ignavibacteriales bacterium]
MIELQNILTIFFIVVGSFFMMIGSVGVIRLPDFFTRSHATSKSDTLGIMLIILGLMVYEGFCLNSLKLLIIFVFVAIANPVGAHALARAALSFGIKPWFKKDKEKEE